MGISKLVSIFVLAISFSYSAQASLSCGSDSVRGLPFKYCIDREAKANTQDVLFFLHGVGGSENTWTERRHQSLRSSLLKSGALPVVVTVSFGEAWLLTNVTTEDHPPLLPMFVMDVLPKLEQKIGGVKGRRFLMGESMGGLNAAVLSISTGNNFSKVALVCPALFTVGPFSPQADVEAYIQRHQPYIKRDLIEGVIAWGQMEFPTKELSDLHDPIQWAERTNSPLTNYLVSASTTDEYGVFEGATVFANVLSTRGQQPVWVPIKGLPHCSPTADSIAQLTRFFSAK